MKKVITFLLFILFLAGGCGKNKGPEMSLQGTSESTNNVTSTNCTCNPICPLSTTVTTASTSSTEEPSSTAAETTAAEETTTAAEETTTAAEETTTTVVFFSQEQVTIQLLEKGNRAFKADVIVSKSFEEAISSGNVVKITIPENAEFFAALFATTSEIEVKQIKFSFRNLTTGEKFDDFFVGHDEKSIPTFDFTSHVIDGKYCNNAFNFYPGIKGSEYYISFEIEDFKKNVVSGGFIVLVTREAPKE